MDTALSLFAKHGFDRVSVDRITEQADVAKGTFFNYFPTKVDVLVAYWAETVDARVSAGLLPLGHYLTIPRDEWYAFNGEDGLSYALGWSVTFFLMSSEGGIASIRAVLQHCRDGGEQDVVDVLDRAYPGGFATLEKDWRYWAMYGERTPHRY